MVSPAPAPTESTATNARPLSRPWRSTGCTSKSFRPSSEASLMVQTTLPITRPSCMSGSETSKQRQELFDGQTRVFDQSREQPGLERPVHGYSESAPRFAGMDQNHMTPSLMIDRKTSPRECFHRALSRNVARQFCHYGT